MKLKSTEVNWINNYNNVFHLKYRNRNKFINQIRAPGGHIQLTIMIDTQQQYIKLNIHREVSIIVVHAHSGRPMNVFYYERMIFFSFYWIEIWTDKSSEW